MMEELINKMVRYRAVESISQAELAKRCKVSLQTINSIEAGLQEPSKVTKEKILLVVDKEG
jgi:DNA-binding XRE family transcriptional regulator